MAILEEQKVKFFQFLDNILKEKSTAVVDGGDLKTKDLKKEGGEDNMAEEKRLEDMEKKLQELSDTFAKDKKAMEDAHKASIAEVEKKLSEEKWKKLIKNWLMLKLNLLKGIKTFTQKRLKILVLLL